MGIGFDVFKANVGWNLANGFMEGISNALEQNAAENAARAQAEKVQSDKDDMLKTLVFMVGNNIALDRNGKKEIASILSEIYKETISLFSIEDKINTIYSDLQSKNTKQFFANIAAINTDREHICYMYVVVLLLYSVLSNDGKALPVHAYNLSLIKRFFAINHAELVECYSALGKMLEQDVDNIADLFEELTSEETIRAIEESNPILVHEEKLPDPVTCENPKDEIKNIFNSLIEKTNDGFSNFVLADSNPNKVIVAVKTYAKNCKGEEAIALYDDSAFGNGKVGFLLTNKKLYFCNSFEKPNEIELSAINSIVAVTNTKHPFINVNDFKIETDMASSFGAGLIGEFLEKAIPFAIQIKTE